MIVIKHNYMKMNEKWRIAGYILLSMIGLTACEQEQSSGLPEIDENKINVTAAIEGIHTRMTGSDFENNDAIGVYVVEYVNEDANPGELANGTYKNIKFSNNNGAWTSASPMYWQTKKQVDVIAYYPYYDQLTDGITGAYPWTINSNQSTLQNLLNGDFLWAKKTTLPRRNAVPLTFVHKMSKIVIKYKLGEGFTSFPEDTPIDVQTRNGVTTTIDLKTGTVTPASRQESYQKYQMYETRTPESDIILRQDAILIPQTLKAGDEFIIIRMADLGLFKYTLQQDMTLQPGYEYTFDITLTKGGIQVSIGNITDWTRPETPNSGNATAVVPPVTADIDNTVNEFWDRISATTTEEILIHYGDGTEEDPTRIYFKPEGQENGYTVIFDKDGYPDKLVTGGGSEDSQELAVFVPDLSVNPPQLGVGLITSNQDRENPESNILLDKVDMPANITDKNYPERLNDIIDILVNLVEKNNLTEQVPPEQFGQGSELLDNLLDELEQTTQQPTYTGGSGTDVAINDSINSLLAAQSPGSNNGNPFTPEETTTHLQTNETNSTTGADQAIADSKDDIQMIESGVQGGFGDVKVTLTWSNRGDMDLHLLDPQNYHIYYNNKKPSGCNGYLDIDNTSGFYEEGSNKPENIFYPTDEGVTGTYYIKLSNYSYNSSYGDRNYTLYVYAFGKTKTYRGILNGTDSKRYFKFTVNGPANVIFSDDYITGQSW